MSLRLPILLLSLLWMGTAHSASPQVVTSIKPVHSLTAAIMGETGTPVLLISGGASPHTFALKPSHATALSRADIVVWVGPELERFLEAPLANLATRARSVALLHADNVTRLPSRKGGVWDRHVDHHPPPHDGNHGEAHHEEVEESSVDPHAWLDVTNAIAMTHAIERALAETYPGHAAEFAANATRLRETLAALDAEITALVAPVKDRPYVVFHDAYQYFEVRYGLSPLGAVTASPDLSPGARRLTDLKSAGTAQGQICVFAEPQFEPRLLALLTEGGGGRLAHLDPLGSDIAPGPSHYEKTLRALASSLVSCLEQS